MPVSRHPSTRAWVIIHVGFPMMPFLLGGLIRLVTTSCRLSWTTFSASELAICLALLAVFINQSLIRSERLLDSEDKKAEAEAQAALFLFLAVVFTALFAVVTGFGVAVRELHVEALRAGLHTFEIVVFAAMPLILMLSVLTQQSFRLKANI